MKHVSAAEFRHAEGERLLAFWRAEYIEHQIPPQEPEPGLLIADTGHARITVRVSGADCRIEIACTDADTLPDFRTGISLHMAEFDPDHPPLAWSGAEPAGSLPPSFAKADIVECRPLGTSWWRMRLALAPASFPRFAGEQHWHFRLLRPANPAREPVWPRLDGNGTIEWPEGPDMLSNRVFTVRACDPGSATLDFDIYRHPGGPTCDWAETRPLGQTVGLMGPGAKAGPSLDAGGDWLLAGGDETSIPAILRGLDLLPHGTPGRVFLLAGTPEDVQPTRAAGPEVTWLLRSEGATEETLTDAVQTAAIPDGAGASLWFAASQGAARKLRSHARETLALPREQIHSVGYWS